MNSLGYNRDKCIRRSSFTSRHRRCSDGSLAGSNMATVEKREISYLPGVEPRFLDLPAHRLVTILSRLNYYYYYYY
jgi:hypothetical protein